MKPHTLGTLPLAVLLVIFGCSRDPRLTIVVTAPSPLPPTDTVFVAGNAEEIGTWRPDGFALDFVDSTTWRGRLQLPVHYPFEFKVTRGSWGKEALLADGSVPGNHSMVVTGDTTIRIVVPKWKDEAPRGRGITGAVEYLRQLDGEGIPTRDAIVWLPPSYHRDVDRRYPVLYAHDGQNLFDPQTSYTGVDWQIDEHADSLSRSGRMQEIIVVGIYNTPARSDEYNVSDAGLAYLNFIASRLKPKIDSTYRTLPGRDHTGVMGSSMGGTISFQALWKFPHVFSRAACLSPFFPETLPDRVAQEDWDISGLHLYIDNGGDDLDSRLQKGIDRMLPVLRRIGFRDDSTLVWHRAAGAPHNERAWAERVWRPLLYMFGANRR